MKREKHYTETIEYKKNVNLADEIVCKTGINIVTCGNCGTVVLHRIKKEYVKCYKCRRAFEPCDMPDLFYSYR